MGFEIDAEGEGRASPQRYHEYRSPGTDDDSLPVSLRPKAPVAKVIKKRKIRTRLTSPRAKTRTMPTKLV
jgi:hypothetical protein